MNISTRPDIVARYNSEGLFDDYGNELSAPSSRAAITEIIVEIGTDFIPENAFAGAVNVRALVFEGSKFSGMAGKLFNGALNSSSIDVYLSKEALFSWIEAEVDGPRDFKFNLYVDGRLEKDLVIPHDTAHIAFYAFHGCISLDSVEFDRVGEIGSGAFWESTLRTIYIKGPIDEIDADAFCDLDLLTTIEMSGLQELHAQSFSHCSNLQTIRIELDSVPTDEEFIDWRNKSRKLLDTVDYFYAGVRYRGDAAIAIDNKDSCPTDLHFIPGTRRVATGFARSDRSLTSILLPALTDELVIEARAFENCFLLHTIDASNFHGVLTLGSRAFACCYDLDSDSFISNSLLKLQLAEDSFAHCYGIAEGDDLI